MKLKTRSLIMAAWMLAAIATFTACKKADPFADFTFNNSATEGKVLFMNSSEDAETFSLDFGDGSSSTEKSPDHTYSANGVYSVTLVAKSSKGGKDSKTKQIRITNVKGRYMFWMSETGGGPNNIYINGAYKGTIATVYPNGVPECGSNGCVTLSLESGSYEFSAKNQQEEEWEGTIEVISGECSTLRLKR